MISYQNCETTTGLKELRSKNINEIAELINAFKERKKNLDAIDSSNERENIKKLRNFAENQGNCFTLCKKNLYERFEKDIIEYKIFSNKNSINFDEDNIKKLEKNYKDIEQELCLNACSKKYGHLLRDRM
ncbi:conserved Plasmodium protein, unknown function [Plasmodium malariae]|uniref:Uncharacterized protein n=1 Tax=Plasmodium malariae TaxID=5858 RepID=A0A1C3L1L5_PLAMA|nr:conserved Plasmodium protein, unknown function [Plasmodium malariae]